jgi:hypothetical protein
MDSMDYYLSKLDPELASMLVEHQSEEVALDFYRNGVKTIQDLQRLWQEDENFFGSDGYSKGTLKIIKARLERFRAGHDTTQDMDAELYAVLKQHMLLSYAFMLEAAGIKTIADIGEIWGKQKDFKVVIGSANYNFEDLRSALHEAYGFWWKEKEYDLRIGEHVVYYELD